MICQIEMLDNLLVSDANQLYLLQVSDEADINCLDMFTGERVDDNVSLRVIELAMEEIHDYLFSRKNKIMTK